MHAGRWLAPIACVVCTSCASITGFVSPRAPIARTRTQVALLVPYVSQSELLCGGAAIAMIERWWGRRGVFAEDFAYLVQRDSGGIFTTDMARVMHERGWDTDARSMTPARVKRSVSDSVPVVALIRVGKKRYHYVVILAWTDSAVTYHDPAVSPSVRSDVDDFVRQWAGANQWAMIVRPASPAVTAMPTVKQSSSGAIAARTIASIADSLPCRPFLDRAADAAAANQLDAADGFLASAVIECPSEPLVLRELAGVRFRQGKQSEAIRLADEYSKRAPSDSLGWLLLASSRYLANDARGALVAWNAIGRPTIDLLRIDGTRHIRFRALSSGMDIAPRQVLTPSSYALAQRRIDDIPAVATGRVAYTAIAGGVAEVRATVLERAVVAPLPQLLAVNAMRAALRQDVLLRVDSPLGLGEAWSAHWRWRSADPRVAFRLDIPARIGIPGVVSLERSWETYRFSDSIPGTKRGASALGVSSWVAPDIEQLTGARFERWSGIGDFVALSLGGAVHKKRDRISLLTLAEHGFAVGSGTSYDVVRARASFTTTADRWLNIWSMRLGTDWTSASTPRGLWSVAGGNLSNSVPLRAHPLIVDGVFPSSRTARSVVHAGVAGDRALATVGAVSLGLGVFVDGARLMSTAIGAARSRTYVDAGAGVRVGLPGSKWPALRVDVARGLVTDRRWAVTAGIVQMGALRLRQVTDVRSGIRR